MKLNNLQKNFFIFFSVIVSILIATLLWEKIALPLNNIAATTGPLSSENYNPNNDTIRYIFFISLPLIIYLFLNQKLYQKNINFNELIFEKSKKIENHSSILVLLLLIFLIFIFFEFLSIKFSFSNYVLDSFHDGNYLTPTQNYWLTKNIWISSYLTHGAADIFYPSIIWKIFGAETIGATRTSRIFLILLIKLLSVLLSYQLTKITNLNKNAKILFFTVFTSIIISMSKYSFSGSGYYFSHKDIYIILFLIFFIELFVQSKFRLISTILICAIATISIFLQIDRGAYIFFILFIYLVYLFLAKKYNKIFLIFLCLGACWILSVAIIGLDEFKSFLNNTKTIVASGELIHGLKYPTPFLSMASDSDGARATRALILQLTAGLFVLHYLISNENKMLSSKKILFIFLFLLSLIIFKNALGRSDAAHIRGSHDIPILLNIFFILNYLFISVEKKFLTGKFLSYKPFLSLSIIFLLFYYVSNQNHFNLNNVKNYNKNFTHFINLEDEIFLDQKTINLIKYYKKLTEKDNCVEHITYEDSIPYLLKKPSCTKYWASWLASPAKLQKDYINQLKKAQPKYILYYSLEQKWDGLEIYERIKLVDLYIMSNYRKYHELDGYIILEKR